VKISDGRDGKKFTDEELFFSVSGQTFIFVRFQPGRFEINACPDYSYDSITPPE